MSVMTESSWHNYPKIKSMSNNIKAGMGTLLEGEVVVEEKIDGSQLSFGLIDGELKIKSKHNELDTSGAKADMFDRAIMEIKKREHLLHPEWTYRAEYLAKPRHNVLAYERVPKSNIIIFDVEVEKYVFLSRTEKDMAAEVLGFEVVPLIFQGQIEGPNQLTEMLDRKSILGGERNIEGIVVKNYAKRDRDGSLAMAKFVSTDFKEKQHNKQVRPESTQRDVLALIAAQYRTSARWEKAAQALKEGGRLKGEPKDIGGLCHQTVLDVHEECAQEIKDELFLWAWPQIKKQLTNGLAQWYLGKLSDADE